MLRLRLVFRFLVVLMLSLWLPVQAVAGVTMPFCKHGGSGGSRTATAGEAQSHHRHADAPADHHGAAVPDGTTAKHSSEHQHGHGDASGTSAAGCNDCGACHLACAAVIAPTANLPAQHLSFDFCVLAYVAPSDQALDQPHPPPLA